MNKFKAELFLLAVIIIEGYILLSTEILAIRLTIPFVGSGTDTVSIIIAAVLLPLAAGYYMGGKFVPSDKTRSHEEIRSRLASNFLIALAVLAFGLSYVFLEFFFTGLGRLGFLDRQLMTAIYAVLFLIIPVYTLGQTIPLISHYYKDTDLPKTAGKILFFSTLGSFAGATFTTLVLMSFLGVHHTVTISLVLLTGLYFAFAGLSSKLKAASAMTLLALGAFLNSAYLIKLDGVVANNPYNTLVVREADNWRMLMINNSPSSFYTDDRKKFEYVEAIENIALAPLAQADPPRDILVIGAGAFTIGHEDITNHYDFVDIDKDLKRVAEERILKEKIPDNQKFFAQPARAFLNGTDKKYDVIILDAFSGRFSLPEHLLTREFFQQVKSHLNDRGIIAANLVMNPSFASPYARNLDATFRSVFPSSLTYVVGQKYDLWSDREDNETNIIYFYKDRSAEDPAHIYSDMKNDAYADRPKTR